MPPTSPFVNIAKKTSAPNPGSGRPIDEYDQMPFGKYKGVLINDVPTDYLRWAVGNSSYCDPQSDQHWPELHELFAKILVNKDGAPPVMKLVDFCVELRRRGIKVQANNGTVTTSEPIDENLRTSFLANRAYLNAVISIVDAPAPRRGGSIKTIMAGEVRTIIRDWYRKIVIRFHPDRGGTQEAMNAIATSYGELRDALAEWEKVATKSNPGDAS